jgi:hypothetical protein
MRLACATQKCLGGHLVELPQPGRRCLECLPCLHRSPAAVGCCCHAQPGKQRRRLCCAGSISQVDGSVLQPCFGTSKAPHVLVSATLCGHGRGKTSDDEDVRPLQACCIATVVHITLVTVMTFGNSPLCVSCRCRCLTNSAGIQLPPCPLYNAER